MVRKFRFQEKAPTRFDKHPKGDIKKPPTQQLKEPKSKKFDPNLSRRRIDKRKPVDKPKKTETVESFEDQKLVESFDKAFVISLGLIALLSLLVFIPLLGPLLILTFLPYLVCNIGCKHVQRKNGVQVGFLVGVVWSLVELFLLFQIIQAVSISLVEPEIKGLMDIIIISLIIAGNLIFCIIGGYTGGAKFAKGKKLILAKDDKDNEKFQPKMKNRNV